MEKCKKEKNSFATKTDEKKEKSRYFHEDGLLNKVENECKGKKSSKNGKRNSSQASKKITFSNFSEGVRSRLPKSIKRIGDEKKAEVKNWLILHNFYIMIVPTKSYKLPSQINVDCPTKNNIKNVKYFSDCVFKPCVYGR